MKGVFKLSLPGKIERKSVVEVELTDLTIYVRKVNGGKSYGVQANGKIPERADGGGENRLGADLSTGISISLADVVGCHRLKGKSLADTAAYFAVYSYPAVKVNGSLNNRVRHVHTFEVSQSERYQENSVEAGNWVTEIRQKTSSASSGNIGGRSGKQRCLYVLVNPHGGPGKALEIFQNQVVPVLAEANTVCKLVITERANHAKDLVRNLDLSLWDGIVTVSGDGLIFEVLNGFMMREDREEALKMPLGVIPGGSGNALASAICYTTGESILGDFAMQKAVMIARPLYMPMKLIHAETEKEHIACFMGVAWGLISDIDIESEKYRKTLGSARFTYYSFVRVARLRKYRGRISYLKYAGPLPEMPQSLARRIKTSSSSNISPLFKDESREEHGRWMSDENVSQNFDNAAFDKAGMETGQEALHHNVESRSGNGSLPGGEGMNSEEYTRQRELWSRRHASGNIPPLSQPVPENWTVIEDDFVYVCGAFMSHLSEDILYLPQSKLDDGIIYLTLVRAGLTRVQLAKILFGFATGEHVKYDQFEIIPVVSFRLEPVGEKKGILTADGEQMDTTKLQVSVTSYKAQVMGR